MLIPSSQYYLAVIGFLIIGTGMGPIYPAIQHMAPANFGKKFAAAINKLSFNQKVTLNFYGSLSNGVDKSQLKIK